MRYALSMNFEGSVRIESETAECRILELTGSGGPPESTDPWQMAAKFTWPQADDAMQPVVQLRVGSPLAGALTGTFRSGHIDSLTDQEGAGQACMLEMDFEISGSAGSLDGARGAMRLAGTVMPYGFFLTADLDLDAPAGAWVPLNSDLFSASEAASGGSHVGSQPLLPPPSRHRTRSERGGTPVTEHEQRRHNPPGVTTGSPERSAQRLEAPEMAFDLALELDGLHRERSWATAERNGKTLIREPDFRVVLTAMHAGTRLAQHDADARITIQTVQGHLRAVLPDRAVDLPLNHLLALDRNVRHEVEALEDSAFLLTLAWPGSGGDRDG